MPVVLILLGPPGAGKGTQAKKLIEKYEIAHISTGDALRAARAAGTPMGKEVAAVMDAGQLVSDDLVLGIVRERLTDPDTQNGFILDGFPRTTAQAEGLGSILSQLDFEITRIVQINVPDQEVILRNEGRRSCPSCAATFHIEFSPPKAAGKCDKCGTALVQREDDKLEKISTRLDAYHKVTQTLSGYYGKTGLLRHVDGMGKPDDVFARVVDAIEK